MRIEIDGSVHFFNDDLSTADIMSLATLHYSGDELDAIYAQLTEKDDLALFKEAPVDENGRLQLPKSYGGK
jgi:hypothetical protein